MAMGMLRTKILAVLLGPEGNRAARNLRWDCRHGRRRHRSRGQPEWGARDRAVSRRRQPGRRCAHGAHDEPCGRRPGVDRHLIRDRTGGPDQPPDLWEPGSRVSHRAALGLGTADRANGFAGRKDPGHGPHSPILPDSICSGACSASLPQSYWCLFGGRHRLSRCCWRDPVARHSLPGSTVGG